MRNEMAQALRRHDAPLSSNARRLSRYRRHTLDRTETSSPERRGGRAMTFHVGQMVVCLKRGQWNSCPLEAAPVYGVVYTVRGLPLIRNVVLLLLEEIVNEPQDYDEGFIECGFHYTQFRPVKETSIDIFRKIVADLPIELDINV
jgi:hypothetical protein